MTNEDRAALVKATEEAFWKACDLYETEYVDPGSVILAAIEPAIRADERERCAAFVETHRVAHINNQPFHRIHPNHAPMSEPDATQATLADAIRALAKKEPTDE